MPSLESNPREVFLALRKRCKEDVLFLARTLGYDWVEPDLLYHRQLAEQAMSYRDTLTLAPRGFIKSTIITVVGTVWYLLNNPEHCVLLVSNNASNAKAKLREITNHFTMKTSALREVFPDFCPQEFKEEPTTERFTLPNRQKARKESSIEAAGIDTSLAGRHYERIVPDDVVHEQNVIPWSSEEVMEQVWLQYLNLSPLLVQGYELSHRTVVGTRWHDGDTYGRVLYDHDKAKHFQKLILKPLDEDGQPIWPSRFGHAKLLKMREETSAYLWACWMEQDPLPPESAVRFEESWFKEFDLADLMSRRERYSLAITVDPAFTDSSVKSTNADRSAVAVTAVPPEGGLYVLAVRAGRFTPNELCDVIFDLYEHWLPEWAAIEVDGGGRAVFNTVRDRVRDEERAVFLRELRTRGQPKDARVSRLSAYAERYGVYYHDKIRRDHIDEILRYPVGRWRDIPDVLAYRVLRLTKPDVPKEKVRPKWTPPSNIITGGDLLDKVQRRRSATWDPWRLNNA